MNKFNYLKDYSEICKPRVVLLMIITSIVGMCLASPHAVPIKVLIFGNLGIGLVASAAAAFNHAADQHIDQLMRRTQGRPVAQGRISFKQCMCFATGLCLSGTWILFFIVNSLTAFLTFLSLIGYAVYYTLYLKHATPQNIVIGGISGAIPPLLGWTAVTQSISPEALLLVLIIYIWTPPHFWALAIYRVEDYAKANVPMLPHTHGIEYTKLNILLYTVLLICISSMPFIVGMAGWIYFIGTTLSNALFMYYVMRLYYSKDNKLYAILTFRWSIYYLTILFLLLLFDHYI